MADVKNSRITFFDTTKGILMLLLVEGHLIIFAKSLGIRSEFYQVIQNSVPFYRAFFMQTFFFITGFCTTWNAPFRSFLVKNLKTLILPGFAFMPLMIFTEWIVRGVISWEISIDVIRLYLVNGIPWFLSALFISKILYWLIQKGIRNGLVEWSIVMTFFLLGLVFYDSFALPNNWHYQHALMMLPFLCLGRWCKVWNRDGFKIGKFELMRGGESYCQLSV